MNCRRKRICEQVLPLGLLALTSLVVGCGEGDSGGATVKGIVTFQGKPVSEGAITFVPHGKPAAWSSIAADGTFSLTDHTRSDRIDPGTYTAFITTGQVDLMPEPGQPIKPLPVPLAVTSQASSPLVYDIKPGLNELDVNLDELPSKAAGAGR